MKYFIPVLIAGGAGAGRPAGGRAVEEEHRSGEQGNSTFKCKMGFLAPLLGQV